MQSGYKLMGRFDFDWIIVRKVQSQVAKSQIPKGLGKALDGLELMKSVSIQIDDFYHVFPIAHQCVGGSLTFYQRPTAQVFTLPVDQHGFYGQPAIVSSAEVVQTRPELQERAMANRNIPGKRSALDVRMEARRAKTTASIAGRLG